MIKLDFHTHNPLYPIWLADGKLMEDRGGVHREIEAEIVQPNGQAPLSAGYWIEKHHLYFMDGKGYVKRVLIEFV